MTAMEIEQIKQKLIALRAELQKHEGSSGDKAHSVEPDEAAMGRLSLRAAMEELLADEDGARKRARLIQKIDGALRRIQMGDYGKCFICEDEIEADRLLADPTITRCINCEEE